MLTRSNTRSRTKEILRSSDWLIRSELRVGHFARSITMYFRLKPRRSYFTLSHIKKYLGVLTHLSQ